MTGAEALALVKSHVTNKNLIKHMVAVAAVMGALAERAGEDVSLWQLTGLLHDIDYDHTAELPAEHSKLGAEMLAELKLPRDLVQAVLVHNEAHGIPRETPLDKALYCSDPVTGLIVAGVLIHPSKKIASIDADFILNRYGEKSFARGANREAIASCEELGLTLREFVSLALAAMQDVASEIGL
ncbi:MAG: Ribonuclease Y [Firmicutes bacterium]|nr:Ribonuclease Y [candidate division NPL-UPA2 bacterium]MBT9154517.1 Ribonuclease Y [candidate division NPL-UPA2 bacterium]MBT9155107.1 Ribonuclease Y [candidate division NPL-UPA2 bacterium]